MSSKEKTFLPLSSFNIPVNFYPVVVGKVSSAHGVLGWLKIVSFTEKLHNIMSYQPWFIKLFSKWHCVQLENWKRCHDDFRFIVKFKEIIGRDKAKLLNNRKIFIDVLQFPTLRGNEYYWKDIIGFRVVSIFSYDFGIVVNLIETGANDVLVVKTKVQENVINKICLVPFIDTVIKDVDCLKRIISVDWDPTF